MRRLVLPSLLALLLAACGGKESDAPAEGGDAAGYGTRIPGVPGMPGMPGMPGATGVPGVLPADPSGGDGTEEPVALTDRLMEQYLDILKEWKKTAAQGQGALLARYGWSTDRWLEVQAQVSSGLASAGQALMAEQMAEARARLDEQIAQLEGQLANASGAQAGMLQEQLDALREAQQHMAQPTHPVSDLDRRNMEVLKRWMPKIEEAMNAD